MMERLRKIKIDKRSKRLLAAWLGICMVIEVILGGAASLSIYASNTNGVLYKELTVSEKEIQKAIERGRDIEDVEIKTPYKGEDEELAREVLDEALLQSIYVKQESLGDRCRAVVALYASEEPEEGEEIDAVDQVILIGMNGNKDRSCVFTLKITNAENIVVRTVSVTAYSRLEGEVATASDASPADATSSDASFADATPSDAVSATSSDLIYVKTIGAEANKATGSELSDQEAQNSEAALYDSYEMDYRRELDGTELENFVEYKKARTFFLSSGPEEEGEVVKVMRNSAPQPMALIKPTGIAVVIAAKQAWNSNVIDGIIAGLDIEPEKEKVNSGEEMTFKLSGTYNNVNENVTAYFVIRFKAEGVDEKTNLMGPETVNNVKPVDSGDPIWQEIQERLRQSSYSDSLSREWCRIPSSEESFYYCPSEKLAIYPRKNGNSQSQMPVSFQFQNGITPNGACITAESDILNKDELIDSYLKGFNDSPGQQPPSREEAEAQLKLSEPVTITNIAEFGWEAVSKKVKQDTTVDGTLGNMWAPPRWEPIVYTIKAQPKQGANTSSGVIYTKRVTVTDTLIFEGIILDLEGLGNREAIRIVEDNKSNGRIITVWSFNNDYAHLLKVNCSSGTIKDFNAVPVLYNNDRTKIAGITFTYTVENSGLTGDLTLNDNKDIVAELELFHLRRNSNMVKIMGTSNGDVPKVTNRVTLDAYSVLYDDNKAPEEQSEQYSHSEAEVTLLGRETYPIAKTAYRDAECKEAAKDDKAVFGPEAFVWYQIHVKNHSYKEETFTVTDQLPAGAKFIKLSSVKLIPGKGSPSGEKDISLTDSKSEDDKKISWTGLKLEAGEEAILTVKTQIDKADTFNDGTVSTKLTNTAEWFKEKEPKKSLGKASANVLVNSGKLTAAQLKLEKVVITDDKKALAVGGEVVYQLNAELTEKAKYSQTVILTDQWPSDAVTFTEVRDLPANASSVVLKDSQGQTIATYTNNGYPKDKVTVSSFKTLDGKTLTSEQIKQIVKQIASINVTMALEKTKASKVYLVGKVTREGEIENEVHVDGSDDISATAKVYALGMSIEKRAYLIEAAHAENIDAFTPLMLNTASTTFKNGDVICYEVAVKNTGTTDKSLPIAPVITDDLSKLFDGVDFEFAKAQLNGKNGSLFYLIEGDGVWNTMDIPANKKITLDLAEMQKTIPKGKKCTLKIYIKVPMEALKDEVTPYDNTATAEVQADGQKFSIKSTVQISTVNKAEQMASIEKSIFAIGKSIERAGTGDDAAVYLTGAKWYDADVKGSYKGYSKESVPTAGVGDYVFYKITIKNESNAPLDIYEIEDELPKGMEFDSFFEFATGAPGKVRAVADYKLSLDRNWVVTPFIRASHPWNWIYSNAASGAASEGAAAVGFGKDNRLLNQNWYRARLYQAVNNPGNSIIPSIPANREAVFGIIAKVTKPLDSEDTLTNTAGVVVGSNVKAVGCAEMDTTWNDIDKTAVGGKTYSSEHYKVLTDSVSIKGSKFTPGIEKRLEEYAGLGGTWKSYVENPLDILPSSWMRWKITLHNGTNSKVTQDDIESYTVRDVLPDGLAYNEEDPAFFKVGAQEIKLPNPKISDDGKIISWTVKRVEGTENSYEVLGAPGNTIRSEHSLAIPSGKTLELTVGTKPASEDGTGRYGTYKNEADLILNEELYKYTDACIGEIREEEPRAVFAVASVDIYGGGVTKAWKTVRAEYLGKTAEGDGLDSQNNTVNAEEGETVTYSLHVQNKIRTGGLTSLTLIDRLPSVGDNGIMNNAPRSSGFRVILGEQLNESVSVGDRTLSSQDYSVYYAKSSEIGAVRSALPETNWQDEAAGWSTTKDGDSDFLKIVLTPAAAAAIQKDEIVTVTFDAKLPESIDIDSTGKMNHIAWNSFAYRYRTAEGKDITVEPAKVGVKTPVTELTVSKEVVSPVAKDMTAPFTFILERAKRGQNHVQWTPVSEKTYKLLESEVKETEERTNADGAFTLKNGQTARFTVTAEYQYRVREQNADGYYVTVKDFGSSDPVISGGNNSVPEACLEEPEMDTVNSCTFINTKESMVLPETGGPGTAWIRLLGILMAAAALLMLAGCRKEGFMSTKNSTESKER